MEKEVKEKSFDELIREVEDQYDADILLYFGELSRPWDDNLIQQIPLRRKHQNVLLFLTTFGGDAHAAYRIARAIQESCKETEGEFFMFVNSACFSAGTLLTLGADKLIMSRHGELGPLDVQLRKADEVGEHISGLTGMQALNYLDDQSISMFQNYFAKLRIDRDFPFSTKLAADVASEMTSSLMGNLYSQIDPLRVAENDRSVSIAFHYGERIKTNNVKSESVNKLILSYPSHNFCIDRAEAQELFNDVLVPADCLSDLGNRLKGKAKQCLYGAEPTVTFIEPSKTEKTEEISPVDRTEHNETSTAPDDLQKPKSPASKSNIASNGSSKKRRGKPASRK